MSLIQSTFLKLKNLVFPVGTGDTHTIVLGPSPVQFIEMEDALFHHNSAVLMPEVPTPSAGDESGATPTQKTTSGLDVIKTCIIEIEKSPEKSVLIAGHTDTSGDFKTNIKLSELRSQNVLFMVQGKREDWVGVAEKKNKVEDYKQILEWVARTKGFPCHPGTVNNTHDSATTEAVKKFQDSYNKAFSKSIKVDGIVGKQTWGAIFDVYEEQLEERLFIVPEKLQKIRDGIQFLDGGKPSVGCGEHHPIDQPDRDNFRSGQNRRVEILFFDPGEKPNLVCHPGPGSCKPDLCQIYDRINVNRVPIPVVPTPKPGPVEITIEKIETTDPDPPPGGPPFHSDDDFCPFLKEKAKIHVKLNNLKDGFTGKLRMEIGRLTNRADDPKTPDVNESFTLLIPFEKDFTMGRDPLTMEFEWDGKAAQDAPAEFSNRKTPDHFNGGNLVDVPIPAIAKGKIVPHGLYTIDSISVLKGPATVKRQAFKDVFLSVPLPVNLTFNANWPGSLATFGLRPFRALMEDALHRFGGRDYLLRDATLTNRLNVRFFTDTGKSKSDSIFITVGGQDPTSKTLFGLSAFVSAAQQQNIFVMADKLKDNVQVFPNAFMVFNVSTKTAGDKATFRKAFGPLGVAKTASHNAPGTATARTVSGGKVTGACDATDFNNVTVTLNADGIATVTSTNLEVVPVARARDIQRGFNTFLRMVGNTTNHELGHALGIAAPNNAQNQVTVGGVTRRSPLPHDSSNPFHNKIKANTNIVDGGPTRTFQRRVEASGSPRQKFSSRNTRYLRDCVPFAPADR